MQRVWMEKKRYIVILWMVQGVLLLLRPDLAAQEALKNGQTYTNSIGIEFILIPAGSFIMGEALRTECNTCNAAPDETPRRKVLITKPFYIGRYEVTQLQWLAVMDSNPSHFKGDMRPVESVSWNNVQLFIHALNVREKTTAYRLPTEAEWEYAARAGSVTAYSYGEDASELADYGWYVMNSKLKTHPIGQLAPNPWGLCDMHGNVYEWCRDLYLADYYSGAPVKDPTGPAAGDGKRVRRGGYWGSSARILRSSDRDSLSPEIAAGNTGFRLVKELQ
jgi:formylglycine-generating enzyme required for sulfatase activity